MSETTSTTTTTTAATATTITPIYQLRRVLFGVANNLEQIMGLTPLNDTNATLNAKYSVQPTTLPTTHPTLNYFGIGLKGKRNIDSLNLSQPVPIREENMDLYGPIPFRCVPVEQDLDDAERAQYAMRRIITPNASTNQSYAAYYLKRLTKVNSQIEFYKLDSNGNDETYTPDYSNLNPVAPTSSTDGTVSSIGSEINAVSVVTVTVTGAEIAEAINVLYGGDGRYATLSEVGLYTGTDQTVTTVDYQGNSFSYTEAILAQLHTQYTFNGYDLSTANASYNEQFSFGSGRVILL